MSNPYEIPNPADLIDADIAGTPQVPEPASLAVRDLERVTAVERMSPACVRKPRRVDHTDGLLRIRVARHRRDATQDHPGAVAP